MANVACEKRHALMPVLYHGGYMRIKTTLCLHIYKHSIAAAVYDLHILSISTPWFVGNTTRRSPSILGKFTTQPDVILIFT